VPISQAAAGWLIFLAAMLVFVSGFALRSFVGRKRDSQGVRRIVHGIRDTAIGRFLFGPIQGDVMDGQELDHMILMPTMVVACGLCLCAIFLLGIDVLS
jgi:hypothetical protein